MYKVDVNLPNVAKGTPVEIDGLGVFVNGSETEVTNADATAFRAKHSHIQTETDDQGQMTNSVVQGPTLSQAFKGNKHIKITKLSKRGDEPDEPTDGDHADVLGQPMLPLDDDPEGVNDNA
jgi:hypothetical protein